MTEASGLSRGVLYQRAAASRFQLRQYPPSPALAPFVDYYWIVRWDLRGEPAYEQAILPHPNVHLTFEPERTAIYGVITKLFLRKIEGQGVHAGRPVLARRVPPVLAGTDRPAHRPGRTRRPAARAGRRAGPAGWS